MNVHVTSPTQQTLEERVTRIDNQRVSVTISLPQPGGRDRDAKTNKQ